MLTAGQVLNAIHQWQRELRRANIAPGLLLVATDVHALLMATGPPREARAVWGLPFFEALDFPDGAMVMVPAPLHVRVLPQLGAPVTESSREFQRMARGESDRIVIIDWQGDQLLDLAQQVPVSRQLAGEIAARQQAFQLAAYQAMYDEVVSRGWYTHSFDVVGEPEVAAQDAPLDFDKCWRCQDVEVPRTDDLGLCKGCIDYLRAL